MGSHLNVLQGKNQGVNGLLNHLSVLRGHNWWMHPSAEKYTLNQSKPVTERDRDQHLMNSPSFITGHAQKSHSSILK